MGEFEDQYTAELEGEVKETRGALVNDTITVLSPAEPICLRETATDRTVIVSLTTASPPAAEWEMIVSATRTRAVWFGVSAPTLTDAV